MNDRMRGIPEPATMHILYYWCHNITYHTARLSGRIWGSNTESYGTRVDNKKLLVKSECTPILRALYMTKYDGQCISFVLAYKQWPARENTSSTLYYSTPYLSLFGAPSSYVYDG